MKEILKHFSTADASTAVEQLASTGIPLKGQNTSCLKKCPNLKVGARKPELKGQVESTTADPSGINHLHRFNLSGTTTAVVKKVHNNKI